MKHSILLVLSVIATCLLSGCAQEQNQHTATPQVLAEHGAWTWFNDERALFTDSHLFIGYVDTAGYSSVTVVSPGSDNEPQTFRLGSFREVDDHNNPAFLQLDKSTVLATYAPHHTQPFWYWRFGEISENGSVQWSEEQRTDSLGAFTTYSNLFQLTEENGRIFNFFRGTNFDPNFMISDDGGKSWNTAQHFITSGGQWTRPYVKYAGNGTNRIDLLFTQAHPRDDKTNIYHAYYEDGNLFKSDGSLIQPLPGDNTDAMQVREGTLIYDAAQHGRAWVWDLEYSAGGSPVAVYVTARDSTTGNDLRYHYARWDDENGRWHEQEIAFAGTHLYDGENHYAGGITIDPSAPNIVYTSSDVHPASGDTTAHYQIYRGITEDEGRSWSWTILTPEAKEDNIRPFVPRGGGEHHVVLWLRGRYTTYLDYDTDIVGLFE